MCSATAYAVAPSSEAQSAIKTRQEVRAKLRSQLFPNFDLLFSAGEFEEIGLGCHSDQQKPWL